jgi:hypothetical protein
MWPATKHFGTHFAARAEAIQGEASVGDHLQAVYHLWLVGHQLEHGNAPWLDPWTFRPESSPRVNFGGWPFGLPYWPLWAAFGPVAGWNLLLLLTYLAAGGVTYLWLRELGLPRGAALVGGLAFELAPYRVAQSAGHLRGMIAVLLPLALWAFEQSRRGSRWWLVLAAVAIASIPFSDLHLALGAVPFFLLYAVCRSRDAWTLAGAVAGVALAVGAALLVSRLAISGSIASGGRSLGEVAFYSAEGLDFLSRHRRHGSESFVFVGWLTPLLALAGLVVLLRARRFGLALALAVGVVVPTLLALGTHFPLYSWLWDHFSPLRYPRVPEREFPVACLAIAALVAFAVAAGASRFPRLVTTCYLVVLVALFVDLRLGTGAYRVARADPHNAAYTALNGLPPGRLLELPVLHPSVNHGSLYLYYDMQVRRQRPGGYSTLAPKRAANLALQLESLNCGEWRPGDAELLRRLGVRYITFHSGLFPPGQGWFAWQELNSHGWSELDRSGGIATFASHGHLATPSLATEPNTHFVFCPEWDGRSPRYRHGAFWVRGGGDLVVRLKSSGPCRTTITVGGNRRSVRVVRPVTLSVPLGLVGWNLVSVDVCRADRRVRLVQIRTTRAS